MSEWQALMWSVKQGTEDKVRALFEESGRPDYDMHDDEGMESGRLLSTIVFMSGNTVVRVIEYEGEFAAVAKHMRVQQEVVELERALDPYLETPRDMSTPEGAGKFFREAKMDCVLYRRHTDQVRAEP